MNISRRDVISTKKYIFPRVRASLENIGIALHYMNEVSERLSYFVENENDLTEMEREVLFSYGLQKAKIHLTRLRNIKKSLECILPNPPKGKKKK